MSSITLHRLAGALALTTLLGFAPSASASTAALQPLHSPATGEQHPGKFVWADLFTTDPVAATKFYTGLFGWTTNIIDQNGKAYTVFSNDGHPVAGLAPRNTATKQRPSRWISYIAVRDLAATLTLVPSAGGVVRAPARDFPDRGFQAFFTDTEGSPIGLLQSTSGDSLDDEPRSGDLKWFELYTQKPKAATDFYAKVFAYSAIPDSRTARKNDWLLLTGETHRAGVAPLLETDDTAPGWLGVVRVKNMDETSVSPASPHSAARCSHPRARTAYESRFAIIADSTGGTPRPRRVCRHQRQHRHPPMKHLPKIFLGAVLLSGLSFTTSGCVADVGGGVYYGPHRDPWFHDDVWVDGRSHWYGGGGGRTVVYISPPRPPRPPRIHL